MSVCDARQLSVPHTSFEALIASCAHCTAILISDTKLVLNPNMGQATRTFFNGHEVEAWWTWWLWSDVIMGARVSHPSLARHPHFSSWPLTTLWKVRFVLARLLVPLIVFSSPSCSSRLDKMLLDVSQQNQKVLRQGEVRWRRKENPDSRSRWGGPCAYLEWDDDRVRTCERSESRYLSTDT